MAYCSIDHQTFANDAALLDLHSATAQYTGVASSKDEGSNSSTRNASVSYTSTRTAQGAVISWSVCDTNAR
jgi:hypothetical protein